jgi:hypothetical protein
MARFYVCCVYLEVSENAVFRKPPETLKPYSFEHTLQNASAIWRLCRAATHRRKISIMRSTTYLLLMATLFSSIAYGQELSPGDRKIISSARARYYNLEAAGFQSLSCSVSFDFSTVPQLPSANDEATRKLIRQTSFTLTLEGKGPKVEHQYPAGSSDATQQRATQTTNLLTSLVGGIFQTWPTKGFQGPIPPFDSQIASVTSTADGYLFTLRVPGEPVRVSTDQNYLVTEITSIGGKIIEHPTYAPSPDGMVFVGNSAIDDSEPSGKVTVKYELGTTIIDGLRVPTSARLQVNENIDVKFVLEGCSIKKAMAVHVAPPPSR